MLEEVTFDYLMQNGFAIAITIYLLYERAKFNIKVSECMVKIASSLERLELSIRK